MLLISKTQLLNLYLSNFSLNFVLSFLFYFRLFLLVNETFSINFLHIKRTHFLFIRKIESISII